MDYYDNPSNDGNICLFLYNYGDSDVVLAQGVKVAQGAFIPYAITDNDVTTAERTGGFGSTGK